MAIHFDKSRIASRQKTGFELKGRSSKMATRLDQEIEQLENIVEKCLDQKQNEAMKDNGEQSTRMGEDGGHHDFCSQSF